MPGSDEPAGEGPPAGGGGWEAAGPPADRDAGWFGSLGQLDFDIDFFEKLLARNGDSVEVLRTLGELVSRKGDVKRAVEIDLQLVDRLPKDFLARYKIGRAHV